MINREEYLDTLKRFKDKDLIKVITGIRRCGKSTLFLLFIDYLKSLGIKDKNIISINLEDPSYNFDDYLEFYNYINKQIKNDEKYYVFLDEVQNVDKWEKAVDGLYIKKNIDIYITGSNAYLLSSELATLIAGRYIEIKMLPLSFKEYIDYLKLDCSEKSYLEYINKSSFPYTLNLETEKDIDDYLDSLYNTIIVKDIAKRKKIADTYMLKTIARFMFSNIGSLLSIKKIADTL